MNGQWQIARQRDYRGGEVQALLPEMVGRNQLLRVENALIFPNGYLTAFHQTDTAVFTNATTGICLSLNDDGTYTYFATPVVGSIRTGLFNSAANFAVDVSTGAMNSVPTASIQGAMHAVEYLGKLYCPNATDGILNLSDMTAITITGKNVKHLRIYTNRLWAVCDDGSLLISDNGDGTTWNPANIIFLPNTDPIIDFIPVQSGAVVYSTTSVYAMYGSSYRDITFVLLLDRQRFTSGAVNIDGTVYIVGPRGVYNASLNGCAEIPHLQSVYFKSLFTTFSKSAVAADVVQGIFLQRFESILFMWPAGGGVSQGFVYYPFSKSYTKVNQLLTTAAPFLLDMNDANTDFLIGTITGTLVKSTYPSNSTIQPRQSIIQMRNEDCGSTRSKIWREFSIDVAETVYGVTIEVSLDDSETFILVEANAILLDGRNVFWLDLPRSQSISFRLTINNTETIYLTDDFLVNLTDDNGDYLTVDQSPGNYTLKELRVKFREVGPAL